jgi:hypothetical protein
MSTAQPHIWGKHIFAALCQYQHQTDTHPCTAGAQFLSHLLSTLPSQCPAGSAAPAVLRNHPPDWLQLPGLQPLAAAAAGVQGKEAAVAAAAVGQGQAGTEGYHNSTS